MNDPFVCLFVFSNYYLYGTCSGTSFLSPSLSITSSEFTPFGSGVKSVSEKTFSVFLNYGRRKNLLFQMIIFTIFAIWVNYLEWFPNKSLLNTIPYQIFTEIYFRIKYIKNSDILSYIRRTKSALPLAGCFGIKDSLIGVMVIYSSLNWSCFKFSVNPVFDVAECIDRITWNLSFHWDQHPLWQKATQNYLQPSHLISS